MISPTVMLVLIGILLICLFLGVPIAFSLGISGIVTILVAAGPVFLIQLPLTLSRSMSDPVMLAVPLYILMGEILYRGRIGQQLFDVANAWLGRLRGGTGISAVAAFTFFAAIVGSSMASVLTIGRVAIPEMERAGYSKRLKYGISVVGGSLGILIPPSIPLILYASLSGASPAQLFLAGILPGLLIATMLSVWAMYSSPKITNEEKEQISLRKALVKTFTCLPDLMLPVVVLGGIYLGIYTPTEAASVGVVFAILLTVFWRKTISFKDFPSILISAVRHSVSLLSIVVGALIFGASLTLIGLPQLLEDLVLNSGLEPWAVLLIMMGIWIFLGFFLEVISIILITVPVFIPMALALGFDPVWYGVLMVITMELAVITPPLGMNLFALKAILKDEKLEEIIKGTLPSTLVVIIAIILVWIFPQIALWPTGR
jgi:C4-dicarboxylate transporter DctM subunit